MAKLKEPVEVDEAEGGWESRYRLLYLIKGAYVAARTRLADVAGAHGLTSSEYTMLSFLHRLEPCSAAEIARALKITPQAATQHVAQLKAKAMIESQENADNRRISLISMTPLGRESLRVVTGAARKLEDEMLAGFDEHEQQLVTRFLLRTMKMAQQKG